MTQSSGHLYVFLDEGGNFDFSANGSKFFTLTTVTKRRPFALVHPLIDVKYELIEDGHDIEYFHATEDKQPVRNRVFETIRRELPAFHIDSLIVEKAKTMPHLQDPEEFYPMMIGYLLRYVVKQYNMATVPEVIVTTDSIPVKKKRRSIEKAIKQTLSSFLPRGTRYRLLHHASRSCQSLQVADYCNWAIFRKWEREDLRSYELIREAIRSEFDIFQKGNRRYY